MIILISLMKPSPSGLSDAANCGQTRPITTPATSASTTWPNRERKKRDIGISGSEGPRLLEHKLAYKNVDKYARLLFSGITLDLRRHCLKADERP